VQPTIVLAVELRNHLSAAFAFRRGIFMNRTTNCLAGFLLAIAPLAFGQEPQLAPQFPEDVLAVRQLVAWSRLQKPQPTPQPLPPPDTPIPQPDPQDHDQQAKRPADPQNQQTPTQSFTGKIVKDGGRFVLKVATNSTYQLDAQSDAKQYENQDVKIIGSLDSGSNTIRVVKIELLS
jgi:hypothetical protein